ncbi:MAG: hypothetical protein RDU20_00050 [Desulfomonilaceae bacterium]|nr:hypothetical protein [Desulfomonilaceae bacterium]
MRRLEIILLAALCASLLMVSSSLALPSCCGANDRGAVNIVGVPGSSPVAGFGAPSAPEPSPRYRTESRRAASPPPFRALAASSVPSCCAVDGARYPQGASRYVPNYGQVGPRAASGPAGTYGGCCGAPVYSNRPAVENLPSCCSTGRGSYARYQGAPAPASNISPCRRAGCGTGAAYEASPSRQPARAVPASATQRIGNAYYRNSVADSGPFGKPGYFPTVRNMW